jgi:hypothetical protein
MADDMEKEGHSKSVGEAIYYDSSLFVNQSLLIDSKSQVMIKSFLYSKESNTPPFKDLQSTPASFVDDWMIVRNEFAHIKNLDMKEAEQNGK